MRENPPQSLVVFAKAPVGPDSITKPSNLRELPLCSEEKCYCSVVALSYRAEKNSVDLHEFQWVMMFAAAFAGGLV